MRSGNASSCVDAKVPYFSEYLDPNETSIGGAVALANRKRKPSRRLPVDRTTKCCLEHTMSIKVVSINIVARARAGLLGISCLLPTTANATDEIQVYNADIAQLGQWTIEQHLNYTHQGHTSPDFPGAVVSNHALNGTPELAYGVTHWWEIGFYAPFAADQNDRFLSNGAKLRNLFVVPDAANRSLFYGVNFEFSYQTPPFSQTRYALEIRPIIGTRNKDWEFIANPIIDIGFGSAGETNFAPALRLARNLGHDRSIGLEYYADFGQIGKFLPVPEQSHQLFAVADFKLEPFEVELGVGYGLTPGSDRWVSKLIFGYAFPVENSANVSSSVSTMNMSRKSQRLNPLE